MPFLTVLIISVVIFIGYCFLKLFFEKLTTLKDTDIHTDLKEFKESFIVSKAFNNAQQYSSKNITKEYELKCIIDPLKYENDPSIPTLLSSYNKILAGETKDTMGYNVPSETLCGRHNPDYDTYIKNQAKYNPGLASEYERITRVTSESEIRNQFIAYLINQDIPAFLAKDLVTDNKIETYTEANWNTLCKAVKNYLKISDREVVSAFYSTTGDTELFFDYNKFLLFEGYYDRFLPKNILCDLIQDKISEDQVERIIDLTIYQDYNWEDAYTEILNKDDVSQKISQLHKKYGWGC